MTPMTNGNGPWRNLAANRRAIARSIAGPNRRQENELSLVPLIPIVLGTLFMLGVVIKPI
jgi:hypothetical protein